MENDKVIFGVFKTRLAADKAVEALKMDGFTNSEISVILPDHSRSLDGNFSKSTKAPEGATTGASTGAVIGGALGLLAGIGALAIPGVGPLVAAGPIMAALAGVGVGGVLGGVSGALIGVGVPEFEAKRYEDYVKNGGILLSVHTDYSGVERAKRDFEANGAVDVAFTPEAITEWKNLTPPMQNIEDMKNATTETYRPLI